MLLTLLLAPVVAFQTPSEVLAGQPGRQVSLLRRLVPIPTGRNGYEEYLMAADSLRAPQMEKLARYEGYLAVMRQGHA